MNTEIANPGSSVSAVPVPEQQDASAMPVPRATYRLQFHGGFRLRQAIELVPYLATLGISHLYASPLLRACPGSLHGYDVCDYSRINPEIGTELELEELVTALRQRQMGLVLDIVPNHMGICGRENPWWWDVLTYGQNSRFAKYFDIDWASPDPRLHGKVLVPVLGDLYGRVLDRKELQLVHEQETTLLAYYDNRFPIAPGTWELKAKSLAEALAQINADLNALDAVIQKQNYRLADWHYGDAQLNYRRFFNICSLAGVREEEPEVFSAAHATLLRWYGNGWIDGLRVDHPDGLHDPREYLERLRAAAPRAWIVAEKILLAGETMAEEWPVAGTTGYEFIRRVTGLFIDSAGEKPLTDIYVEFTGEPTDYGVVVRAKQRQVLAQLLKAEVNRLTRLLLRIAARYWRYRDLAESDLREALIEVTAQLPVYCTYIQARQGRVPEADAEIILNTIGWTRQRRSKLPPETFEFIEDLLLLRLNGDSEHEFVMRFQQLSGPTMAKGAEDTACYCYNRMIALNEVGADPGRFQFSPDQFHERCREVQQRWPTGMLTTSTHDTKRSEDVRMRICLLSEIPNAWRGAVARWSLRNERYRRGDFPDRNVEYFYYQTLVGAWPLSTDRALLVMEKASREAKQHTSWIERNVAYDTALREFVTGTLTDGPFVADLERFVQQLVEPGYVNSLAMTLLKLTSPGVPDIYQGNELWDLSLVDPDNRRPIDFALRGRRLGELLGLSAAQVWARREEGLPKLWLTHKTLQARRLRPELFGGGSSYQPLQARGRKSGNVLAFSRGEQALTVVPRLILGRGKGWEDTRLRLPEGRWRNEFTGEIFSGGDQLVDALLRFFPVGLLFRTAE